MENCASIGVESLGFAARGVQTTASAESNLPRNDKPAEPFEKCMNEIREKTSAHELEGLTMAGRDGSPSLRGICPWWTGLGWWRGLFLSLVVLFVVALGYSTLYRAAWNYSDDPKNPGRLERTDYTVYSAVGQAVLDGTDIYQAHNQRGWFYVYPPPFAILMVPFAKLSIAWGVAVWFLLTMGALASALDMSCRLARGAAPPLRGPNDLWSLAEWPVFVASPWLFSGVMRCQASEFMVWLVIAAIYFWWRGRPVLGGLSLALATLLKAFPLALMAYFVWKRQWRFIAAFSLSLVLAGVLLPASVYGWQKNLDYWGQWGRLVAGPALSTETTRKDNVLYEQLLDTQKPRNQSIESLLLTLGVKFDQVKSWLAIIAGAMLATMLWAAKKADGKTQLLLLSAFTVWNLLIPPISESHYFGLMILPLGVLTAVALADGDRIGRVCAKSALAFFLVTTLWSNLDKEMHLMRLLCWAALAVWLALMAIVFRRVRARDSVIPA